LFTHCKTDVKRQALLSVTWAGLISPMPSPGAPTGWSCHEGGGEQKVFRELTDTDQESHREYARR